MTCKRIYPETLPFLYSNLYARNNLYFIQAKGGEKCDLTRLQFIPFWITSSVTHACPPSGQASPPIFIVGTHRDSISGSEEEKQRRVSWTVDGACDLRYKRETRAPFHTKSKLIG